jgi:dTDP-glucose 4,6-dehydratase
MIEGFYRLIDSDLDRPVNLGRPEEVSVLELAERIQKSCGSISELAFTDRPVDDPKVRRPDISLARERLGWEPKVTLEEGLDRTVAWARDAWFGESL